MEPSLDSGRREKVKNHNDNDSISHRDLSG